MPAPLAILQLHLLAVAQLTRHHQPWPWIPPPGLVGHGLPPLIPAGQIQLDRFGHALFGSNQQSQGVVVSQPAKRERRLDGTLRSQLLPIHRPTELQVQGSGSALHLLRCECVQPWGASQQKVLLQQNQGRGQPDQDQRPLGHGSSGRSGRSIGSIVVGTTTATAWPLRV